MPSLTPEQRDLINAAIANLTGDERIRARARLRSRALRHDEAYRLADNAKKAEHGRDKYHADLETARAAARRKARRVRLADPVKARIRSTEAGRRHRARLKSREARPA